VSMYNMLFGVSGAAPFLLAALGLKREDVYRFRDCYLSGDGEIALYTRGGGGNRECHGCLDHYEPKDAPAGTDVAWTTLDGTVYKATVAVDDYSERHVSDCTVIVQAKLRKHPCYLRDDDDDFDCTYSTFYFSVPDSIDRDAMASIMPEVARGEVWEAFIAALGKSAPVAK
jgi:hypothetical protein